MNFAIPRGFRTRTRYTAPINKIDIVSGEGRSRLLRNHIDNNRVFPGLDIRWQEPPNPYIKRNKQTGEYTWNLGKPLAAGQVCFWFDRQRQAHMYIAKEEGVYPNNQTKYVWKRVLLNVDVLDARTGNVFDGYKELYP